MIARALAIAALLVAACGKSDAPPPPASNRPVALTPAERQRGSDACHAYVDHLCACAKTKPELADRCQLKHAKIDALALALQVDDDPSATPQDVFNAQDQARKIIAKCIEENEALAAECP